MKNSCSSGKRSYPDESLALEALIQHHIRNSYKKGEGPINIYQCQKCGEWHFTSKGVSHIAFDDPGILNRIATEQRAYDWEKKLR